jgi:hypothetical protein
MRLIPTSRGSGQRITTKGFGMGVRLGAAFQALALVILLLALPAHATDLTGTWQGTISADGQVEDFTASFSDEGYALFDYTNNRGLVRTLELSASKRIQFVPPGGGVTTVAVESVVKRPGGLSYVLHTGFERTSAGYLDQRYVSEWHEYSLTNAGLRVRLVSRAATYFGDRGGPVGGPQKGEIFEGILKKIE